MKETKILAALGQVDDAYIAEARRYSENVGDGSSGWQQQHVLR